MNTHPRRLISVIALVALLLLTVGSVSWAKEVVRLRVGVRGAPERWAELLPSFHKLHPDIVVDFVDEVTWNLDKVITAEAAGLPYDVVYSVIEQASSLVEKGIIEPLDTLLVRDTDPGLKAFIKDVHPALLKMWQFKGKQYYLPFEWNNMVMYYNPRSFNEAGLAYPDRNWTWNVFLQDAKRLTKQTGDNQTSTQGFGCAWWNPFGIGPWIFSAGGRILDDSWSTSVMNDSKVLEAVEFVRGMIRDSQVLKQGCDVIPETGRVAMWGAGRWVLQYYVNGKFNDFDIALWPKYRESATTLGGGGYGISASSKHKDAAWEFIKWANSIEVVDYWTRFGDSNASRKSIAMSDAVLKQPASAMLYYEALNQSIPVPSPPAYQDIDRIFNETLPKVWTGEIPAKEAVDEMHRQINLALKPKK